MRLRMLRLAIEVGCVGGDEKTYRKATAAAIGRLPLSSTDFLPTFFTAKPLAAVIPTHL
jgi:hypothetical protein